MIRNKHLTKLLFTLTISLLLIVMLAAPAPAVKKWRESKLRDGWQIWIEAADFNRRNRHSGVKRGQEVPKLAPRAPQPILGEDIIIATGGGFAEYDFVSPVEGQMAIYARVMDFRGGGQSWIIAGMQIATGAEWEWRTRARGGPFSWHQNLEKGLNTIQIIPRETGPGKEVLMDVLVVSSKEIEPTDKDYQAAAQKLAVQPVGKLATVWAALKNDF